MIGTDTLNKKLIASLNSENNLGLATGKMGYCLYFYVLSRKLNNKEYQDTAEKLLDEIFDNIQMVSGIDVKNGLAGIGLGIDYLIKNSYVNGNVNDILEDIDNIIFKQLSYPKYTDQIELLSLIHITYYLQTRLREQKKGSENEYLFKELIIETINNLYLKINHEFHQESFAYDTDQPLPQLLYLLSVLYNLDFYNYRLIKIIEEISYSVLSTIPILHANRLFLLWGMDSLNKEIANKDWKKNILLLRNNIDVNHILNDELSDKNIFFNNGIASIYCLIKTQKKYFSEDEFAGYEQTIRDKIVSSTIWQLMLDKEDYFSAYKGLYNGYCSILLIL